MMDQECLDNAYTHFVPKEAQTNKKIAQKQLIRLLMFLWSKCDGNPMHLTNYMIKRWIKSMGM